MKKLEYRIFERTKLSVPYCNYCVISDEPVFDNATHELVAYHEDGSTADIVTVGGINGVGEPIIWCRRVRQPGYYQISFSFSPPLL